MGTFKIEITAVGGHGQDRSKKNGEVVNFYEGGENSPDAITKTLVEAMKFYGTNVEEAKIIHWPGAEDEVTDDLLTGIRSGDF